ncbi:putative baseplate assembly protein [Devosia sp.]|uniref:putative baseplate assembly protein n=1 Tax=Devosia sp. TaxID=1871048 RepID=UPI002736429E|nr:putative baseplate assembly protein [Devosia sp.]MDP2782651.1 putative baseplate assembly protein [Devosia sp.]
MTDPAACGCCEGVESLTPLATVNRPGLPALSYRIGTHATFLETMKARLSSSDFPSLAKLTSREADDPAIALLDAWATVGDVLTFYQERIANEGYLRTATERRSVLELARLVGYQPRPGVAASVYLAYTIDPNYKEETVIPAGSRSQSIPGPEESAQSFETSEDLKARAQWNNLRPRIKQPQTGESIRRGDGSHAHLYLKGISTNLKPNDPLLINFGSGTPEFHRVREVVPDAVADHTRVMLQAPSIGGLATATAATDEEQVNLIESLTLRPSVPPANARKLVRNLNDQFGGKKNADDDVPRLLTTLNTNEASYATSKVFAPSLRETLTSASANAQVTPQNEIRIYALRVKASLFGHNAPREPQYEPARIKAGERTVNNPNAGNLKPQPWPEWAPAADEESNVLFLDTDYDKILGGTPIAVEQMGAAAIVYSDIEVNALSRSAYGINGKTTKIILKQNWWDPGANITPIRTTTVYAQSEPLELAEEPIVQPVCGGTDDLIELDGFYEGLEAGRWVVVSGEREIDGTSAVRFSELSMLSTVSQSVRMQLKQTQLNGDNTPLQILTPLPGDKTHTFIKLAAQLAYCFKRDTAKIHGNVVTATHGETRTESLGSGDGSKPLQQFNLKQPPLTFVPASNPSGVDSTLKVYVNDVQWRESNTLLGLSGKDRRFVTQTDDEGKTAVIFGNGREGARLPTGIENARAVYRNGIGKGGNVKAEQISLLSTRPLGAKEVINPLPASGGADKETRDQARKNAPLAVTALDRLVSVQDYEDFARVFAGIGKARAAELSDGRRQIVHLTIAGADDIPIETHSDLYRNLTEALRRFGDPYQPFRIELRELKLLVLSARVRIHPDYLWEKAEPKIRAALLDTFSFERRELGQDALLSEAISVMQSITGVEYVDVDTFGGVSEKRADSTGARRLRTPAEIADDVQVIVELSGSQGPEHRVSVNLADFEGQGLRPAQLAYLSPLIPATLILNEAPR